MIVSFDLQRATYYRLLENLTDEDIQGFNAEFGYDYTRQEFAYIAPTISVIDDLLQGYYGRAISFQTGPFKVRWREETIQVEVEIRYRPYCVPN